MSELISKQEAKLAWANGEDVEVNIKRAWLGISLIKGFRLVDFDDDFSKFRLKPQTITLNGIEVPKPDYIVDTPHDYQGTWEVRIGDVYYLFKSQDNYEKFVAALQSIFK